MNATATEPNTTEISTATTGQELWGLLLSGVNFLVYSPNGHDYATLVSRGTLEWSCIDADGNDGGFKGYGEAATMIRNAGANGDRVIAVH